MDQQLLPKLTLGESRQRILVADDEVPIRHFCQLGLQRQGLVVDEAVNGSIALEACQKHHYDLVLLDVDMPEMNGLDVCRRLRQAPPDPHLKIIMFSGRASPDDLALMLMMGADDYLTKSFTLIQLQARVQAA